MSDRSWKFLHTLWIIPTACILINGLPFIFIGLRVRNYKWAVLGILFELPTVLFYYIYPINRDISSILALLILLSIITSFVYALFIRNEYYDLLQKRNMDNARKYMQNYPTNEVNNNNNMNYPNNINNTYDTTNDMIQPVDINNASAEEISTLPGINIVVAKKILNLRKNNIYFYNMEDLSRHLNLSQHQLNRLQPYIIFNNPSNTQPKPDNPTEPTGRKIDL